MKKGVLFIASVIVIAAFILAACGNSKEGKLPVSDDAYAEYVGTQFSGQDPWGGILTITVRSIVDGHIFLSRKVAEMNHYPAIDVLGSISRLFTEIVTEEHKQAAYKMRKLMALYRENKDLIDVGMYNPGSNPKLDTAIQLMPNINAFLQQRISDSVTMKTTISSLISMMKGVDI